MLLHDSFTNGQAQSGTAFLAGVGSIDLLEPFEDGCQLVGGNAPAWVGDGEEDGGGGWVDGFRVPGFGVLLIPST